MKRFRTLSSLVLAAILAASAAERAGAQGGPPNALQGFSQNRGQPINITADTLELRDKEKIAIFSGKVKATQGNSIIECAKMTVFYDGDPAGSSPGTPRPAGASAMPASSQIRRLEADGGVIVTQKDQMATGNRGIYDMRANNVTLIGDVTATQGKNTIKGDKLIVDLTTGYSRVESTQSGGQRVMGTFNPSDAPKANDKPQRTTPAAPPPGTTPRSSNDANGRTGSTPRPNATRPTRDAQQTPTTPLPLSR